MSTKGKYTVHRRDVAGLIARLANSLVWNEFGALRIDLDEIGESAFVNVYVDGLLAATLRPVEEES